ncbi:MAG: efflux transporter outer membrane subunit [Caulobacteraceae bacterium]
MTGRSRSVSSPRAGALALAALALTGCIDLAPAYRRPAQPTPAAFPSGPAYPPPAAAGQPVVGWRDFFSDPKLAAIIDEALANNRDLREAVANIAAARAQYQVQRASQYPHLNANASATFGEFPTTTSFVNQPPPGGAAPAAPSSNGSFHEHQYDLNLGVSAFELDLFGRLRNLSRAAQDQYFATREARDAAQITLVGEVAADYLALASDRSLLKIGEDTVANGGKTLTLTRARLDAGVASGLDVSQAQTIVEQARFDVARLVTQIAQDRNALELVVGAPVRDDLLPAALGAPVVVLSRLPAGLPSAVLLRRPDVLEAEQQLRGANANIGAARAVFFPAVSLTGSGGLTSNAFSTLFRGASATWTFIPSVTQPIFDFCANRGNLNLARTQRDLAVATYEKAIQTAFREVADALAQRGTIDVQLAAQNDLVAAARNAFFLANARYQAGADTYLNALVAERTYYSTQQTQVTTQLIQAANLVTLYTALGGGLDAPPSTNGRP